MYHEDTVVMIKTTKYTPGFLNTVNRNIKILNHFKELLKISPDSAKSLRKFIKVKKKKKVGNPQ